MQPGNLNYPGNTPPNWQPNQPPYQYQPQYNPLPQQRQSGYRNWYRTRSRKMKFGLGCGTLMAVLLFFSCIGTTLGSGHLVPAPQPTLTLLQAML